MKPIRRMVCGHAWTWVERRQDEVCRSCGVSRAGARRLKAGAVAFGAGGVLAAGAFGLGLTDLGTQMFAAPIEGLLHLMGG